MARTVENYPDPFNSRSRGHHLSSKRNSVAVIYAAQSAGLGFTGYKGASLPDTSQTNIQNPTLGH
jgi:hypothetical protein